MNDIVIGTMLAAYVAKDGISKILGPSADTIGHGLNSALQNVANKALRQIENVFSRKVNNRSGTIHNKALMEVLNNGLFSDDILATEYLGGILASSVSENGRDDRAASMAKLANSLTSYQLRTHYLIYVTMRKLFPEGKYHYAPMPNSPIRVFIPLSGYFVAMDFSEAERLKSRALVESSFTGLSTLGLIEAGWLYEETGENFLPSQPEGGIIYSPSARGFELLLSAFGHADQLRTYLLAPEFLPEIEGVPCFIEGAKTV